MSNTLYLTIINFLSAGASFLSGILLARHFGGSGELSGYLAGFNFIIPLNILLLKAHGKAFIPYISTKNDQKKEITTALFKSNFILLVVIATTTYLLSHFLPNLISPGLSLNHKEVTVTTLKILSIYILAANSLGFFQGIFHYNGKFVTPAILNLVPPFSLLLVLLLTNKSNILILPITHTIAILISAILAFLFCKSLYYKTKVKISEYKDEISEYSTLAAPIIFYSIFMWAIKFVDTFMASFINEESISYLEYARKLTRQPEIITGVFATVYFPILARLSAKNLNKEFNSKFLEGAEKVFLISSSIGLLMFLNSTEIISIIYQRGEFSASDTIKVSGILRGFIGVIIIAPLGTYFSNIYYSKKKTKLIATLSVISSLVNIVLNYVFVYIVNWQENGIAIASSTAYAIGIILQITFIKRITFAFSMKHLLKTYLRIILIMVGVALVSISIKELLVEYISTNINIRNNIAIVLIFKILFQSTIISLFAITFNVCRIRYYLFQHLQCIKKT